MTVKAAQRYVELTYQQPVTLGSDEKWYGVVVDEHVSPDKALEIATTMCRLAHPAATDIQEFLQRSLTDEQADRIREAMHQGTWNGWDFERRHQGEKVSAE